MERRSGKRSSSAGSEKMERFGDRKGKMERYFWMGQSPQRAVAPTEEEEVFIFGLSCHVHKRPTLLAAKPDFPRIRQSKNQPNYFILKYLSRPTKLNLISIFNP